MKFPLAFTRREGCLELRQIGASNQLLGSKRVLSDIMIRIGWALGGIWILIAWSDNKWLDLMKFGDVGALRGVSSEGDGLDTYDKVQ